MHMAMKPPSVWKADTCVSIGCCSTTDGSVSNITGYANVANFPEMKYEVHSTVDFKRMRELFFAREK